MFTAHESHPRASAPQLISQRLATRDVAAADDGTRVDAKCH
jgi:hypothetical protein